MNTRKPIIVGIDPGITTAYAVLDTYGKSLKTFSSKNLSLSKIINDIIKIGRVITVGTDKQKTPDLVYKFSAKFGAKIVNPNEDLKTMEKRQMTKLFDTKNEHENDALASALIAFREIRYTLDKINKLQEENKDLVKELVIKKNISIKEALNILNPKVEPRKIEKETIRPKINIDKLLEKLRRYEKEIYFLKKYISKSKHTLRVKSIRTVKRSFDPNKRIDNLFLYKEKRLKSYIESLKDKDLEIDVLKRNINDFYDLLIESNNFYILKKLKNLGDREFRTAELKLKIKNGDILYIEDPNIINQKVIDKIKGKINTIVYKNPKSTKFKFLEDLIFIKADKIAINDYGILAAVRKEELDRELSKSFVLTKIITDYKKEKESTLTMNYN